MTSRFMSRIRSAPSRTTSLMIPLVIFVVFVDKEPPEVICRHGRVVQEFLVQGLGQQFAEVLHPFRDRQLLQKLLDQFNNEDPLEVVCLGGLGLRLGG